MRDRIAVDAAAGRRAGDCIRRGDRAGRAVSGGIRLRALPRQDRHGGGEGVTVKGIEAGRQVSGSDERIRVRSRRTGHTVSGTRRDAEAVTGLRTRERAGRAGRRTERSGSGLPAGEGGPRRRSRPGQGKGEAR